jgi:tetratricopeptide (TPR) repeat protein
VPESAAPAAPATQPDALEIYTLILETDPGAAWAYVTRGGLYGNLSQWDRAQADYAKAIELGANDLSGVWYPMALLHVRAGRSNDYRSLCEKSLARFGQADDPAIAYWLVLISKLAPQAVADPARPVQIAEKLSAREPTNAEYLGILGDTLYRKGDLTAAVLRLEASIRAHPGVGVHWRKLFLSMAYHRLGRAAQARQNLGEVIQWMEKNAQEKLAAGADLREPLPWAQRLDLQLLRQEAEQLLAVKEKASK